MTKNKKIVFFLDIDGVLIHSKTPLRPHLTFDADCVQ
jgi:ribonucleotide monophosphatase NagD (HAD superfamily)